MLRDRIVRKETKLRIFMAIPLNDKNELLALLYATFQKDSRMLHKLKLTAKASNLAN